MDSDAKFSDRTICTMRTFRSVYRSSVCRMIVASVCVLGRVDASGASITRAAANCPRISDPANIIGTVVSAEGTWCDGSCELCPLSKMYPVTQSSQLFPDKRSGARRSVTIRSRRGDKQVFDCSNPRELKCEKPLDLSRLVGREEPPSVLSAFWKAISELASEHPDIYDGLRQGILQTRGSDQSRLSDGVAVMTSRGLNIENIMSRLSAGEYLLELCAVDAAGEPQCPRNAAPVQYSWNPKHPEPYPAPGAVRPGIYRLYRYDSSAGIPPRSRSYAEVLIAETGKYSFLEKDFHQVMEATRSWDGDDPTAPALRRAYLYSLSKR